MTRQQVRNLAGKLMEEWQNVEAVAEVLGCQRNNVRRWHSEYKRCHSKDHSSKEPGRPPKLTANQQNIIRDIIFTKTPMDMNHSFYLWSNTIIRDTIHGLFKTSLSLGTVNAMIKKMGITRRNIFKDNPAHQATETARWLKHRYPFIRKLAQEQHARVLFIHNERIIGLNSVLTPTQMNNGKNDRQRHHSPLEAGMLSAVCPRNSQRFMIFAGTYDMHPFVDFLKSLIHDTDRPLFIIAESQHKKIAMEADYFLSSTVDRLSLFFLPTIKLTANLKSA
jgi:transposase